MASGSFVSLLFHRRDDSLHVAARGSVNEPPFGQPIRVGQPVEHVIMSGSGEVLSLTRICFACLACHLHISSHLG